MNKTLHYVKLTLRRVKAKLNSVKQVLVTVKSTFRCLNKIIVRVDHACACVFLPLDKWNRTIKSLNEENPLSRPLSFDKGERSKKGNC
jgi:hypothetical protein